MTGQIGGIQHFSVGDGPGIRTTVFLQGCPLFCPWCHNPEYLATGGATMTVEDVIAAVSEDRPFFEESCGGVTLSGGEPLAQPAFCLALAKAFRRAGISVLIDSAGQAPFEAYEALLPYAKEYYIDLKGADEQAALAISGASPQKAVTLMRSLAGQGALVTARLPLIPRYTDTRESVFAMGRLLAEAGIQNVSLLPFHNLAAGKYRRQGLAYAYEQTPSMDKALAEQMAFDLARWFPGQFSVTVGG